MRSTFAAPPNAGTRTWGNGAQRAAMTRQRFLRNLLLIMERGARLTAPEAMFQSGHQLAV